MRNVLLAGSLLLLGGCFIRAPGGGPYYGGGTYNRAPAPRPMSHQEAVDRGFAECRARRLECRLQNANLSHNDSIWKVRMRAAGRGQKGHLFLEYDAFSRDLLKADARIRPWRRASPPRWDHDDDWDDDNDGIADRKDNRGHAASPPKGPSNPKQAAPPHSQKDANPKQASSPKRQDPDDDDDDDDDDGAKASKKGNKH